MERLVGYDLAAIPERPFVFTKQHFGGSDDNLVSGLREFPRFGPNGQEFPAQARRTSVDAEGVYQAFATQVPVDAQARSRRVVCRRKSGRRKQDRQTDGHGRGRLPVHDWSAPEWIVADGNSVERAGGNAAPSPHPSPRRGEGDAFSFSLTALAEGHVVLSPRPMRRRGVPERAGEGVPANTTSLPTAHCRTILAHQRLFHPKSSARKPRPPMACKIKPSAWSGWLMRNSRGCGGDRASKSFPTGCPPRCSAPSRSRHIRRRHTPRIRPAA